MNVCVHFLAILCTQLIHISLSLFNEVIALLDLLLHTILLYLLLLINTLNLESIQLIWSRIQLIVSCEILVFCFKVFWAFTSKAIMQVDVIAKELVNKIFFSVVV